MLNISPNWSCAALAFLLTACATTPTPSGVRAEWQARSGSQVKGEVLISDLGNQRLRISVNASGVPAGAHGFHIHEVGDCSAPDASSAKGHYNPGASQHGHHAHATHHAGDLPNLTADAAGVVNYQAEISGVSLAEIAGRSLIMHADPDDYQSQPAGNSGKRIACAVIGQP